MTFQRLQHYKGDANNSDRKVNTRKHLEPRYSVQIFVHNCEEKENLVQKINRPEVRSRFEVVQLQFAHDNKYNQLAYVMLVVVEASVQDYLVHADVGTRLLRPVPLPQDSCPQCRYRQVEQLTEKDRATIQQNDEQMVTLWGTLFSGSPRDPIF